MKLGTHSPVPPSEKGCMSDRLRAGSEDTSRSRGEAAAKPAVSAPGCVTAGIQGPSRDLVTKEGRARACLSGGSAVRGVTTRSGQPGAPGTGGASLHLTWPGRRVGGPRSTDIIALNGVAGRPGTWKGHSWEVAGRRPGKEGARLDFP